jgi:hypothetical protein
MNEHDGEANAGSSRRQFLHMGAGLAGALSVGSLLAACGASAPDSQAGQSQAASGMGSSGPAMLRNDAIPAMQQSNSYLIVAKYNYGKWRALVERKNGDVDNAESAAEKLFPEEETPLFGEGDPPVPFRPGLEFVGTFASDIFARLEHIGLQRVREEADQEDLTPEEKVDLLDPMIAESPPNPPVGWLAVLEQNEVASFVQDMSSKGGHLWEMYDVEIHMLPDTWTKAAHIDPLGPLNPDKTTRDVYLNMSIRNWS